MTNCKNCGAPFRIDVYMCLYCGTSNPNYIQPRTPKQIIKKTPLDPPVRTDLPWWAYILVPFMILIGAMVWSYFKKKSKAT